VDKVAGEREVDANSAPKRGSNSSGTGSVVTGLEAYHAARRSIAQINNDAPKVWSVKYDNAVRQIGSKAAVPA
jgi:hypothetical protein